MVVTSSKKKNTFFRKEREYWAIHEETLWRYAVQRGAIDEKWKIEGFTVSLPGIISGKIKIERLPEIIRYRIFDSMLTKLENKGFIVYFDKESAKMIKQDVGNLLFEAEKILKALTYAPSKKLVKLFGTINFIGDFKNEKGQLIANFLPISYNYSILSQHNIFLPPSVPVIIDGDSIVDDVRIPTLENWGTFYVLLIGAFSYDPTPIINALAIYRDFEEFSEYINDYWSETFNLPESFAEMSIINTEKYETIVDSVQNIVCERVLNRLTKAGWRAEINLEKEKFELFDNLDVIANTCEVETEEHVNPEELEEYIEESRRESSLSYEEMEKRENYDSSRYSDFKKMLEEKDFYDFVEKICECINVNFNEFSNQLDYALDEAYETLRILHTKQRT